MDCLKMKGTIYIELLDMENNIVKKEKIYNIITNYGLNSFIKAAAGEHDAVANRMVIGLDSTEEQRTDAKLYNKLIHNSIDYEIIDNSIIFSTRFPIGSVEKNYWIKEIGLAYFDGEDELLVTRAAFDSEREVFMTPNNILNLKYQLTIISA